MNKQKQLNRWLWKWHIIAGVITVPIMVLLAITGIIYLFKADYEDAIYQPIKQIEAQGEAHSFSHLYMVAAAESSKPISKIILPHTDTEAIRFISGMRANTRTIFVDPYKAEVTGVVVAADTLMMTIRKLHGELLLGKGGTLFVELVASWFVVLILTGIYVWWPAKSFSLAGFFTVRTAKGRRIFYRDLHSVLGFWLSIFMLIILAGAMPWTDVFGSQLKWVQEQTDTGYPITWQKPKGLKSTQSGEGRLSIDRMVDIAKKQSLTGEITLKLPMSKQGVFTVSNHSFLLRDQSVLHFDQYSGNLLKRHNWSDVGILMDARQVAMRLHQGEYGRASWWGVLLVSLLFTVSSIAGFVSFMIRKPAKGWGLPKVPEQWHVGTTLCILIVGLGVLFPMFGGSLVVIYLIDAFTRKRRSKLALGGT